MPEYPFTKRIDMIVLKIIDVLDGVKEAFEPAVDKVYYGDQELIPTYPAIAVEGGRKIRRLNNAGSHFDLTLSTTIWVHHGEVQSSEITSREIDSLSEQVEDQLHGNVRMDGAVIFGYVVDTTPGVRVRGDVMLRTTRLTWEATSKERF